MTKPFSTLDDSSLIKLALEGDAECFSALIDRHLSVIQKRIRSMVRNQADSEDVAQEVVIKVWRRLSTFREESSFRTWMTRIAINEVLHSYRQHHRLPDYRSPHDFRAVPSPADSPQQAFIRLQEIQAVRNAVRDLPNKYRRVLILRDLEELTAGQTAQMLESTVPAVKTRLFRARRMLSAALQRLNLRGLASAA